jgi:hypothetical protein
MLSAAQNFFPIFTHFCVYDALESLTVFCCVRLQQPTTEIVSMQRAVIELLNKIWCCHIEKKRDGGRDADESSGQNDFLSDSPGV